MPTLLTQYNFLRSYANSSQLEHLTNDERFQLLQRIISSGQSESSWRAILELFASWPDSVEKSHALEHADEQLSTWDDSLGTVNSAWIYLYENSHLSSVAVIVRLINISRREQYGNKELKAITTSPFVASLKGLTIYKSEIHSDGINAL